MTPSRLDYHFFKGAYLIGLNHVIFFVPTKQGLKGAYSTGLTNGQRNKNFKRMTHSCLDCHFFKGAYLIGLNHIIFFCADEIGLKECLLNWAYKWPTEQDLNGAYSIGLTHCQRNKT